MRTRLTGLVTGAALAALAVTTLQAPATAAPATGKGNGKAAAHRPDDKPHPLGNRQREMRKEALDKVLHGKAQVEKRGGSSVVNLGKDKRGKDQYVEFAQEGSASIFTVLAQFGDKAKAGAPVTTPGPVEGQIPQPGSDDNSTYWLPSFDRQHYLDMFFGTSGESFNSFYKELSSGRYGVSGDVSDWVTVPYNEASYGDNADEAGGYWSFIEDTAQAWYDAQKKAGRSDADIKSYLAQFDKWDRYDYDGDGNFDEPDGYIDHFQAIHAGEGEEAGAPDWTIWSHRWYVDPGNLGKTGPAGNLLGGAPIGDTGLWIGDYTTEPENGGLGVFTHEFGHDLGLPDLYDTAGGDNGTGFWTLMSAGSWLGHATDGIGTTPGHMGAWEKLQLGWLDYQLVDAGKTTTVNLGPSTFTTRGRKQAVIVRLPEKTVSTTYNSPATGGYEWWGGSADNLNTTLTRTVDLTGATSATLSSKAWYDIEKGYDYLYAEASTDGGATWQQVGKEVTGSSGDAWAPLSFDLSPYAGASIQFRFRYQTDGGVHHPGAFLDDLSLTVDGRQVWSDGAEQESADWTAKGWKRTTGTETRPASHYYLAENRQYTGYDTVLEQGPYNFGHAYTKPNAVDFFPYQDGLLVTYWDNEFEDNNTSEHPGHGLILPVDANPTPVTFADGKALGNRRQPFDATFGLQATDPVTFYRETADSTGKVSLLAAKVPSRPAVRVFDDSVADAYWSEADPWSSVKVAGTGTQIAVVAENGTTMTVQVRPAG